MGGNELEVLNHYNKKILKYKDDVATLLRCLEKLNMVKVNISLLQETGVGRTIGVLKKQYGDSEIGAKARDLVMKWKEVVRSEEAEREVAPEEDEDEEEEEVEEEDEREEERIPTYIPTPLIPLYIPTPIDNLEIKRELPDSNNPAEEKVTNGDLGKMFKEEPVIKKEPTMKEETPKPHKHKKSHRDEKSDERRSESKVRNREEEEKVKDREKMAKKHKDKKEKDPERKEKELVKTEHRKEHKSSKSSHRDKEREKDKERSDKERDRKKNCDKERHETKETGIVRIKTETLDENDLSGFLKPSGSLKEEKVLVKLENGERRDKESNKSDKLSHRSDKDNKRGKEKSCDKKRVNDKEKLSDREKQREAERQKRKMAERSLLAEDDMFAKAMSGAGNSADRAKEKNRKRARDGTPEDGRPKEKRSRDLVETEERNGSRSDDSPERFSIPPPPPSSTRNISSMLTPSISLPEISPVYKPLPRPPIESRHAASEDERLGVLMGQKKTRSAVYSGKKRTRFFQEVPSLYEQCIMVLQDHVDEIDEVGNLNYDVLETVLERANPKTLMHIEDLNTQLMTGPTNTSKLWEKHCMRDFRSKEREEMESWREMYERCTQQRQDKLDKLKGKVKLTYKAEENSRRTTKLAYPDMVAKPPRDVAKRQERNGTGLPVGHVSKVGAPRPRISDPTAGSSRPGIPTARKPKAPPMMAKVKSMMKGLTRFGRR